MSKRLVLIGFLAALTAGAACAGDVAQFANLGFSDDSRYFMFGEYGVLQKSSAPYAEVFIVDVPANDFARHGVRKVTYERAVEPGNDGEGALFNLIADTTGLAHEYRIDHLQLGRPLYVLVDGAEQGEIFEFRDFVTGHSFKVGIVQKAVEKEKEVSSSFKIQLTVEDRDGRISTQDIGNPALFRTGVKSYAVKQILLAPDEKSLVFVVQRAELDSDGSNIRYMVEATRMN